jgi:hypothetical protein
MHLVNCGGSVGTITGCPGLWAAWDLAATYIQWLNACVVIWFPATSATESDETPEPLLPPHAASRTDTIAAVPNANIVRITLFRMTFFTTTGEDSDPIYELVPGLLGLDCPPGAGSAPAAAGGGAPAAASASRIASCTRRCLEVSKSNAGLTMPRSTDSVVQ